MKDELRRTAVHESGHQAVADLLGLALAGVTARGGTCWAGNARYRPAPVAESAWDGLRLELPFSLWPEQVRRRLETATLVLLAGGIAELALGPQCLGRCVPSVAELAEEHVAVLATLPEPAPDQIAALRAAVDDPAGQDDAEQIAELTYLAHGPDLASANAWLGWMEAACRALVMAHATRIERLAGMLLITGTLDGAQAAAALRD